VVLTALLLAFAAGVAGFVVGRETAEEEPAAAETTTAPETTAATDTVEPETTTTETTETETEAATTETDGGEDADGAAVFSQACASCHTFEPAGASGTIGPPLDGIDLSKDEIATQVRNGGGGMPAFEGQLSDAEIDAVSDFVESG
jgi:cytochrome c551